MRCNRKADKADKAVSDAAAAAKKAEEDLLAMEKGCVAHISGLTDPNTQREDIKVLTLPLVFHWDWF